MKILTRPTILVIVGFLLLCIFPISALSDQQFNGIGKVDKFNDLSSDLRQHQKNSDLGKLKIGNDTILFPWASRQNMPMSSTHSGNIPAIQPRKDEIMMSSSNSIAEVQDLSAINSVKQRDVIYEDPNSQNGDPKYGGLVNSLGISVNGGDNDDYDNRIDHPGNYLNIDVRDIYVSAMNTMEGGSAVATSNIIIEPVQIINYPSEVDEKLK
jgi:hypothetical protein